MRSQVKARRTDLLKENPGIGFGQAGKALGGEWKEMSDSDKKPYTDKAAKAKTSA